ncbi:MAG TPA: hypothetical protein DET40_18195 [Lentisphaeria bacterium]|nr:MAG: hypothetical protein A2X45_24995 [Lentisphaerae bacterium GWF2_50_93]HCE45475.1 hypothetical protein [Lentisphaeria bacterium]
MLGATCRAAGELLRGSGQDLISERSASIGGEYFDSYRKCSSWGRTPVTQAGKDFYREMYSRGMMSGCGDSYGLAPILYGRLRGLEDSFMLTTELAQIRKTDRGFELDVYNQSGHDTLRCEELVDNTLRCVSDPKWGLGNIVSKRLNAAIFAENAEAALKSSIDGAELRPGRNSKEIFLSCPVEASTGWTAAREQVLSIWLKRDGVLKDARIEAIAKEFDFSFKKDFHRFDDGRIFLNCAKFANPIEAIDAGLNLNGTEARH